VSRHAVPADVERFPRTGRHASAPRRAAGKGGGSRSASSQTQLVSPLPKGVIQLSKSDENGPPGGLCRHADDLLRLFRGCAEPLRVFEAAVVGNGADQGSPGFGLRVEIAFEAAAEFVISLLSGIAGDEDAKAGETVSELREGAAVGFEEWFEPWSYGSSPVDYDGCSARRSAVLPATA
jgi:hypothetical protein